MTRHRTVRGTLVAAAATLTLAACSTHPGDAAVVNGDAISPGEVDDVATALCAVQGGGQQGQPAQALATRGARQAALGILLDTELTRRFGAAEGVKPPAQQLAAALSSSAQTIAAVPAAQRDKIRETIKGIAASQLIVSEVGRRALAAQGTANPTAEQATSAGTKLRNAWVAKHTDVTIDPRYGTYSKGTVRPASGSLSVAQSARAADGSSPDPSQGWVSSLPASQKCAS